MAEGFNLSGRKANSTKSILFGLGSQVTNLIVQFVYRTLFIMVLSKEYLGLNGLFTNVLTVLSLAELGIGTAIVYRMYKPISENDVHKVAAIMKFYKKVYAIVALITLVLGLCVLPFIKFLIKDQSEIPNDINIYIIYLLFLFQTVASYLFVYKTALLTADQRGYAVSLSNFIYIIVSNAVNIAVLFATKNYTLVLSATIVMRILSNAVISAYVSKKYKFVFDCNDTIDSETKRAIKTDTLGMMCHKLGGVIVTSTDNILLSVFLGLGILGIYSNYSMIILAVAMIMGQLFGTFTSSIGNSKIKLNSEDYYKTYKRLNFVNLWVASCAAIALFVLLNPFIEVWLGGDMVFEQFVVVVLSISFFIQHMRHINVSYTNATGLFKRDKWRPIMEVVINLVASCIFVQYLGVAGIFLGTILGSIPTIVWREPLLLYKYEFKRDMKGYFMELFLFFIFFVAMSVGLYFLCNLMPNTILYMLLKFAIVGIVPSLLLILFTFKTNEFKYFKNLVSSSFKKLFKKVFRRGDDVQAEINSVKKSVEENQYIDDEKFKLENNIDDFYVEQDYYIDGEEFKLETNSDDFQNDDKEE